MPSVRRRPLRSAGRPASAGLACGGRPERLRRRQLREVRARSGEGRSTFSSNESGSMMLSASTATNGTPIHASSLRTRMPVTRRGAATARGIRPGSTRRRSPRRRRRSGSRTNGFRKPRRSRSRGGLLGERRVDGGEREDCEEEVGGHDRAGRDQCAPHDASPAHHLRAEEDRQAAAEEEQRDVRAAAREPVAARRVREGVGGSRRPSPARRSRGRAPGRAGERRRRGAAARTGLVPSRTRPTIVTGGRSRSTTATARSLGRHPRASRRRCR